MMKNNIRSLYPYLPWLLILFAFDLFTAGLLWLSDQRVFQALFMFLILSTGILFLGIASVLVVKERKKASAYRAFLSNPEKRTELGLLQRCHTDERVYIKEMIRTFYQKQAEIEKGATLLSEYEEYVETWAHEIKLPLSLFSLVLDNQKESLPKEVVFKLDYIRNQIQANVSQILFYYRTKSEKKDFLFQEVDLQEGILDVLENFKPLLEEKNFKVVTSGVNGTVYTDDRSFEFMLSQIISNAVKYSADNPELTITMQDEDHKKRLSFKDNGCGVKACDLPHLFERGFTGDSGDKRKKSTGMGLYLVKQLADDLNIEIEVHSDWMNGFEISLLMNTKADVYCMKTTYDAGDSGIE